MARIHHRSRCRDCQAELVHLAGDPSVPYEDVDPLKGGPRTLVEHTEQRCRFARFLTPEPGKHVLPGNADWLDKSVVDQPVTLRYERWVRTDEPE